MLQLVEIENNRWRLANEDDTEKYIFHFVIHQE